MATVLNNTELEKELSRKRCSKYEGSGVSGEWVHESGTECVRRKVGDGAKGACKSQMIQSATNFELESG